MSQGNEGTQKPQGRQGENLPQIQEILAPDPQMERQGQLSEPETMATFQGRMADRR